MLEIMRDVKNYFVGNIIAGIFEIRKGAIDLDKELLKGYKFVIIQADEKYGGLYSLSDRGSLLKDGKRVRDGRFTGTLYLLDPPEDFLSLADEIKEYRKNNPQTGIVSESFGGYSYSLHSGGAANAPSGWREVFRSRLNKYRKMFDSYGI